jgi:protein involved in polysaccharide export with SLBB domain
MSNRNLFVVAACLAVWLGFSFIATSQPSPQPTTRPVHVPPDEIGRDDLLRVSIFHQAELREVSFLVRVDAEGKIGLPVGGDLKVGGLTFTRADQTIARHLADQQIMAVAIVSVERLEEGALASIRSAPVSPGDVVFVTVFDLFSNPSETRRTYHISANGEINLPAVGAFKITGLTESQAQVAIARAYMEGNVLRNPMISVLRAPYDGPVGMMDSTSEK